MHDMNIFEELNVRRTDQAMWNTKLRPSTDASSNSDFMDRPINLEWETDPVINAMRECSNPVDNTMRESLMNAAKMPLALMSGFNKDSPRMVRVINPDKAIQIKIAPNILDFQNETITDPEINNTF